MEAIPKLLFKIDMCMLHENLCRLTVAKFFAVVPLKGNIKTVKVLGSLNFRSQRQLCLSGMADLS